MKISTIISRTLERMVSGEKLAYFFFGSMTYVVGYLIAYALVREEGLAIIVTNAISVTVAISKGYGSRSEGEDSNVSNMTYMILPAFMIDIILVTIR